MSLAVFGGSGFLGKKICEYGIRNGFKVTSYSKSGSPPIVDGVLSQVNWQSANIFDVSTYEKQLVKYDVVIHSMGKIFDNEVYKQGLNGSPLIALKGILNGRNPMTKTFENSFEGINKYSLTTLLQAYETNNPRGKLVYISADKKLPLIPTDYIRTKREAETALINSSMNTLILRPGLMYDTTTMTNRDMFMRTLQAGYLLKDATVGRNDCLDQLMRPILLTDDVCRVLFQKLDSSKQIITLDDIVVGLTN